MWERISEAFRNIYFSVKRRKYVRMRQTTGWTPDVSCGLGRNTRFYRVTRDENMSEWEQRRSHVHTPYSKRFHFVLLPCFFKFHHLLLTSSHSDSFSPPIPLSLHVLSHSHHFPHCSLCSLIPFPLSPPSLPIRLFSPHLLPLSEPPGKDSHRRGDVATTHSTRLPEEEMHRIIFTQISACVFVCSCMWKQLLMGCWLI